MNCREEHTECIHQKDHPKTHDSKYECHLLEIQFNDKEFMDTVSGVRVRSAAMEERKEDARITEASIASFPKTDAKAAQLLNLSV